MRLITKNIYQKITNLKRLQKGLWFISVATLFLFGFLNISLAQGCGESYSALVFDLENGDVLFENEADKIVYPASLTKLMTLYLVFEALKEKKLDLKDNLFASERSVAASKVNKINTLNLKVGDKISVEQAIKGSIVKSYNELTVMLSEAISNDEWQFARDMNLQAKKLEMFNTNFRNSSGLHNQGQFTTNDDLAKLVLAIRRNFPEYYQYFSLKEFVYKNKKYTTHNNVLLKYKNVDGIKTGFTKAAGFNLIASAKKDGRKIISILTGCQSAQKRDDFTVELLDLKFKS